MMTAVRGRVEFVYIIVNLIPKFNLFLIAFRTQMRRLWEKTGEEKIRSNINDENI
jgi:hypothetical protein